MIYLITYDLHNPGRDYDAVQRKIKSFSDSWAHPQGSVWFVETLQSPEQWVTALRSVGDSNDEYFVARLQQSWWTVGMDADAMAWLKDGSRRW